LFDVYDSHSSLLVKAFAVIRRDARRGYRTEASQVVSPAA